MSGRPFAKVLVANRGEIAVRVMRTLRSMGIRSVAVHSDADSFSVHAAEGDESVRIGPPAPRESYLSVQAVVAAAKATGADAVHPGYGFLSERADFARACEEAGIVFVGPPAAVLEATGDKLGVKAKVAKAGVPVIPGPLGEVGEGRAALDGAAKATGFPMLLKAVGGGGGRGLRRVDRAEDLVAAAESARREAGGAFGDSRLYAEAWISPSRHVEVQILCDSKGDVRVLGERDCSAQRRHQKVIEETPAPSLSATTRAALFDAARKAAKALGYVNAGTVEFVVDAVGRPHFLEVNRRLQVEHPVTEMVFGIDLVAWQLRIAAGETLPPEGTWTPRGHAIEARVCAEDPARGFVPSPGSLSTIRVPSGPGLRVDSGFASGFEIPPEYDSLVMKVVAHGETRDEARARLDAALAETAVLGVRNNVAYLRRVLASPESRAGAMTTEFLDEGTGRCLAADPPVPIEAVLAVAAADLIGAVDFGTSHPGEDPLWGNGDPWKALNGWRVLGEEGAP